jgi:tetratricopeptide (TPR) repeat protein
MAGKRDVFGQAMTRGHSAAWDQNWDKAIAYYRAALTEFPDDPNALTSLGFALLQSDKLDEALKVYQRAASLSPGDPVAPEKCGEILERLGRLNEAAQVYLVVAEIHLQRRDVHKATDNWSRVVRITPDNLNAHSRLALAYEHGGKTRQAVLEYLEVARIFQRANDTHKALQAANRALQLEPQSQAVREALDKLRQGVALPVPDRPRGTGALRLPGMTGMLAAEPEAASAHRPGSTAILRAAEDSFFAADEAAASPAQKRASPLGAAQEVALAHLAELLFEEDADTSKTAGSVSAITRGASFLKGGGKPNRAQAVMFLGQAINCQSSSDSEAALENYQNALEAGLDHPLVGFMLGALHLELDRPEAAIEHLRPAISREDVGLGAAFGLGEAYRRVGKTNEALISLLEALKQLDLRLVAPQKQDALVEAYESLADSLLRASEQDIAKLVPSLLQFLSGDGWEERAQKARQNLDSAADDGKVTPLADLLTTPGSDRVLESLRRIEAYMRRELWATAMEEAYHALQFSPTYLPVHIRMAEILLAENKPEAANAKYSAVAESYRMRGEHGRAARIMQEVLRLSPLDVNVRTQLIGLLAEQGKIEDALQQYLDLADTYYQLADLETARDTYADALQLAQRSKVNRSWQVRILHQIGDIDLQRLALREALRLYEQIRSLAPEDEKARTALIELYFRLGNTKSAIAELDAYLKQLLAARKVDTATILLEELVNSYPDDMALLARLGRLYQDQGRKADAIAQYDRLGELQLNAGQHPQAAETIRTILALGPEDRAGYEQLLAQIQA